MPKYRYVAQGEYFITSDTDVIPVTSGMTECVAVSFIGKNPNNRLLVHMDGHTLESAHIAKHNLEIMADNFKKESGSDEFNVYILGGKKGLQNIDNLTAALNEMEIKPVQVIDSREFCQLVNAKLKESNPRAFLYNPTNIGLTMICTPRREPEQQAFSPKLFEPKLSLDQLEKGYGLESEEKKLFEDFTKANSCVLEYYPDVAKTVRSHKDKKFVEKYSTSPTIKDNPENEMKIKHR